MHIYGKITEAVVTFANLALTMLVWVGSRKTNFRIDATHALHL